MRDFDERNRSLFFIALIPGEQLRKEIKEIKESMRDEYGASHALKSPAHITMQMPFKWSPAQEAEISSILMRFAAGEKPFKVELDGYGAFPPRVIYLKVTNPQPIIELHRRLKGLLADTPGFIREEVMQQVQPHITVATRDLTREAFSEAWPEMRNREFTASFTVYSIFLLKHNGRHWDILLECPFKKR
jgi:2'-5' RNA ligase